MVDFPQGSLRRELARRASHVLRSELARRMGYRRVDEKLLERIDSVLGDDLLGLDASGFDFRYSSDAFLVALCDALAIDPVLRDAERTRIHAIITHRNTAFRPFLFVDTGFKRTTEPIVILGFLEGRRWLRFERAFVDLDLTEQIHLARERMLEHYSRTGGELPVWGTIARYLFQYDDAAVLIFDTDGRIIGESDAIRAAHATIAIGGRDATAVFKPPEDHPAADED